MQHDVMVDKRQRVVICSNGSLSLNSLLLIALVAYPKVIKLVS